MIDIFAYTSHGGREYNEDSVGYAFTADGAAVVLADGLGGHQGGAVASKAAVDTILDQPANGSGNDVEWLTERINSANSVILEEQKVKGNKMKSTVVALKISGGAATWAHVGDSRLYYLHNSEIAAVTEDHSVAFKKYSAGEISRADIATDEDQSSLLRSLGNSGDPKIDYGTTSSELQPGDGFMLCSDGMWEYLQDEEILFDSLKSDTAQGWAELLLLRVIERIKPNSDNLSVITVLIR